MEQYIVVVWNHRSECTYYFGPFRSWESVNKFISKVEMTKHITVSSVESLNPASLLGTGNEVSMS